MLRKSGIQQLKDQLAQSPDAKQVEERLILKQLFESSQWKKAKIIATTKSMPYEFDTTRLMDEAWNAGKRLLLPKVYSQGRMEFVEVFPETSYTMTKIGVSEPVSETIIEKSDIDLIVVPGVLFNTDGYRIGFGGGFYDRYLADFKGETCSLVFEVQLGQEWLPDRYDQPVKQLYTKIEV
ncbi:5-formyltetrahydrofolate cyclo-ligase [Vagococcus coleopterorum]|uniref:5-formyltetrahydrofolate cyclo-ligase n=2 Tax=Vagococcus coleopterorum TaxID=2714946 RepID=A0A6G8AMU7_9ENTE|nr:5-formyltetrahydrofolate cyclo-ligase [Vagococcus coleopterorum]